MKQCTDFEREILEGQSSPELQEHLRTCQNCACLKKRTELFHLPKAETDRVSVPSVLDEAIRTAARDALKKDHVIRFPSHLLKFWLSAAACLLICCGVIFFASYHKVSENKDVVSVSENRTTDFWNNDLESAAVDLSLDMELGGEMQMLALSGQSSVIYNSNEYEIF